MIGNAQKRGHGGSAIFLVLFIFGPLLASLVWFFLCVDDVPWMNGETRTGWYSRGVLLLLLWLCGPVSVLIWSFLCAGVTLAERPVHDYSNADDAIEAASKLDMLGDWDEAIVLYQYAAARWPEHEDYIKKCINVINDKRGKN